VSALETVDRLGRRAGQRELAARSDHVGEEQLGFPTDRPRAIVDRWV
jgi:hypothetical protein